MADTVAAAMEAAVTEAAVTEVAVTEAVVMEVAVTVAAAIMEAAGTGTATHTTDMGSAISRRRTTTTGVTGIGAAGSTVLQITTEKERSAAAQGSRIRSVGTPNARLRTRLSSGDDNTTNV